jgi:sugar/nucleoside kinase (ribokinase family)
MHLWIASSRGALAALLRRVPLLMINDEEARLLSGERNMVRAARRILAMGPESVMIKRGEYGVLYFSGESVFAVPAYPLEEVFDPTGAGDTFAGGVMGYLASSGDLSPAGIRRAIVYGSVLASFTVEAFSLERLRKLTREDIDRRYRRFIRLTAFDVP